MSAQHFDYRRYLASREWALRREAVRERCGGWCERCGLLPMAATYHLTYEHIGDEPLEDLQGVCRLCLAFLSGKSDFDPTTWLARAVEFAVAILGPEASRQTVVEWSKRCVEHGTDLARRAGVPDADAAIDRVGAFIESQFGPPTALTDPRVNLAMGLLTVGPLQRAG